MQRFLGPGTLGILEYSNTVTFADSYKKQEGQRCFYLKYEGGQEQRWGTHILRFIEPVNETSGTPDFSTRIFPK